MKSLSLRSRPISPLLSSGKQKSGLKSCAGSAESSPSENVFRVPLPTQMTDKHCKPFGSVVVYGNVTSSRSELSMPPHVITRPDFEQDAGRAFRMADEHLVVITDEGQPSHVLLSWAEYSRLVEGRQNLVVKLAAPGLSDIDFEPKRLRVAPCDFDLD